MKKKFSTKNIHKEGFSLLELLVVIAITAILVAVATVAYSSARKKGIDARQRSNVKSAQDGFEQYFADNGGTYSVVSGDNVCSMNSANIDKYFPSKYPTEITCTILGVGTGYCVCTLLEDATGGNSGVNCTSGTTHYCLKNLQ